MEINPSEYKVLIVDDVISNVLLLKVLLTNEKDVYKRQPRTCAPGSDTGRQ